MIAHGYGLVQPNLTSCTWISLTLFTLIYGGLAVVSKFTDIKDTNSGNSWFLEVQFYRTFEYLTEFIFCLWYIIAGYRTIKTLWDHQQLDKLWKYQVMAGTIGVYFPVFLVLSIASFFGKIIFF